MEDEILNVEDPVIFDDSITKMELHEYQPFLLGPYALPSEVRIAVQHQDICTLPSQSFLRIRGTLTKADGTHPTSTSISCNGILHLIERITYVLNGVEVDQTRDVGITSAMKNYLSLTPNELSAAKMAGWALEDEYKLPVYAEGKFEVCVPLSMLLGFAEDYKHIIINSKQELVLLLANTHINAIVAAVENPQDVSLTLQSIEWMLPHIQVSTVERVKMLKNIENGKSLDVPFRSWSLETYPGLPHSQRINWIVKSSFATEKPRYIIVGLQTGRQLNAGVSRSVFDNCQIRNVKIFLNSESYPYVDMNMDFESGRFLLAYQMYAKFQQAYYGRRQSPILSPDSFKNKAPLMVFDVSKQDDRINSNIIDCRIEISTSGNIPPNTYAFCLILFTIGLLRTIVETNL